MKNILLLTLTLGLALSLSAQNNSVIVKSKKTDSTLNGTVYTIYGDGAVFEIKEEFKAVMSSMDSMYVAIRRTEIQTIPGTKDYFCWYLCYQPVDAGTLKDWYAEDTLWMYKDVEITNFSVYLNPQGNKGQAKYRYTFYPANNPSDSSWMDVCFDIVSVGIEDASEDNISMYPNPASQFLNIDIPTSLKNEVKIVQVVDMTGRTVIQEKINSGSNKIELNHRLETGNYVVRILSDSHEIYKKILQINP